jgi:hypothetical chaperone protein
MSTPRAIGVDFGTTNTVVSRLDVNGAARLATFTHEGRDFAPFRSTLSFHADPDNPRERVVNAGPWAIEAYLEEPLETRLLQSFKSHAASALFTDTQILGRRFRFEDLLSTFLLQVRHHAAEAFGVAPTVIVGRPVAFVGARPDADLAMSRYRAAFARLGFEDIRFAYEPIAAAFFFARKLIEPATVLVGDFGGGTSDFSLVRFPPGADGVRAEALANAGVGLAGDAFDFRIIDNLVSPRLGKGASYKSHENILPIPNRYYAAFARWEQLALLRASRDMRDIRDLAKTCLQPEKLEWLVELLDDNHGYRLYQAVSAFKEALSSADEAEFRFEAGSIAITRTVSREKFETWIAPELAAMGGAIDEVLAKADLTPDAVDRVFLTGGSAFVPAVRRLFEDRFGPERIEGGDELVSIATGLAYMAAEPDLGRWTVV